MQAQMTRSVSMPGCTHNAGLAGDCPVLPVSCRQDGAKCRAKGWRIVRGAVSGKHPKLGLKWILRLRLSVVVALVAALACQPAPKKCRRV